MRRCRRKESSIENTEIEGHINLIDCDHNDDHIYDSIDSLVPAITVPSQDVPRKMSEDGCNFVEPNEQSYGERNKRNTINPLTYEVSTGEDRVTASSTSTTSDIRAYQSLSDDTTKEYDPCACTHVHAHDDQPLHVHSLKSARSNTVYGVVNQPQSDSVDDQSNHTPPSSPLRANGDEPNGISTVINQQINNV